MTWAADQIDRPALDALGRVAHSVRCSQAVPFAEIETAHLEVGQRVAAWLSLGSVLGLKVATARRKR